MRTSKPSRICAVCALAVIVQLAPRPGAAQDAPLAVNYVAIDATLATSGQPSAEALDGLADAGYELVVNLAPPDSRGAVAEESRLVGEDGIAYVNVPVDWQQPTLADFDLFSAVMRNAAGRKVLVHCQMNMRASVFTFLYRVVHAGIAPEDAFEAVREVWTPSEQWAEFGASVLARHEVEFAFPPAE